MFEVLGALLVPTKRHRRTLSTVPVLSLTRGESSGHSPTPRLQLTSIHLTVSGGRGTGVDCIRSLTGKEGWTVRGTLSERLCFNTYLIHTQLGLVLLLLHSCKRTSFWGERALSGFGGSGGGGLLLSPDEVHYTSGFCSFEENVKSQNLSVHEPGQGATLHTSQSIALGQLPFDCHPVQRSQWQLAQFPERSGALFFVLY